MHEALVVLLIFAVSAIVYIAAWLRSRDPSPRSAADELDRLRLHEAWLRERLELAAREQCGRDMIAALASELRLTSQQLARARIVTAAR